MNDSEDKNAQSVQPVTINIYQHHNYFRHLYNIFMK